MCHQAIRQLNINAFTVGEIAKFEEDSDVSLAHGGVHISEKY